METCDECKRQGDVYKVIDRRLCWTCYWTRYQLQYDADGKLVVADVDTGEIVLETGRA